MRSDSEKTLVRRHELNILKKQSDVGSRDKSRPHTGYATRCWADPSPFPRRQDEQKLQNSLLCEAENRLKGKKVWSPPC